MDAQGGSYKLDPKYKKYPSIIHALAEHADAAPDAPAFRCVDDELTYGQYAHAVSAAAHRFAPTGLLLLRRLDGLKTTPLTRVIPATSQCTHLSFSKQLKWLTLGPWSRRKRATRSGRRRRSP